MVASPRPCVDRRFFCMASSAAVSLALLMAGCGSSGESPQELTPEARKSLVAGKVGDTSKFIKPKSTGKRR